MTSPPNSRDKKAFTEVNPGDKVCFFSNDGNEAVLGIIKTVAKLGPEREGLLNLSYKCIRYEFEIIATTSPQGYKDMGKSIITEVKL
jgi:hypothetical protein